MLPALGTNANLYAQQRPLWPRLVVPPWLEPTHDESLRHYARRMARQIKALVDPRRPLVLGGASFGGMVALEMASIIRPSRLLLVSSCFTGESVSQAYQLVGRFIRYLPLRLVRPATLLLATTTAMLDVIDRVSERRHERMLATSSPRLVRWGGHAILRWQYRGEPPCPRLHIHGSDDQVLPLSAVSPDVVIPGAGHLPTLTHPHAVNRILADTLSD